MKASVPDGSGELSVDLDSVVNHWGEENSISFGRNLSISRVCPFVSDDSDNLDLDGDAGMSDDFLLSRCSSLDG